MISGIKIAIIGSGPSAIYLLKHLLEHAGFLKLHLSSIAIYERGDLLGMGMPYNPRTTDIYQMANIPSEEMPPLLTSLADWLQAQDAAVLEELNVERAEISPSKIYSRIALGRYLQSQYRTILAHLTEIGFEIEEFAQCAVIDIQDDSARNSTTLFTEGRDPQSYDKVIIATGHQWPNADRPQNGYFSSPWTSRRWLPDEGKVYNHVVGTLGASLSAFDVVTSLAHRHGTFVRNANGYDFHPHPGTEKFHIVMGAGHGRLPHLRYSIEETTRKIYQHVSREELLALVNDDGFLTIPTYYDAVCRPALRKAFQRDGMEEIARLLEDGTFTLEKFIERMSEEHSYPDAFEGMRYEMAEARESVLGHRPIHWKEVIDDLIYTLNFHAELLPAEDHLFLHAKVMPFLMNVIAAMPLHSADKLLALNDAGKLQILPGKMSLAETQRDGMTNIVVEDESGKKEMQFPLFIDCSGQKPVELDSYPFPSLVRDGSVRKARARFASKEILGTLAERAAESVVTENGEPLYHTSGIDIDGTYRVIGTNSQASTRIYDIAFPHTSGVRPYSYGLQSCSDTGEIVTRALMEEFKTGETSTTPDIEENTRIYEKV